MYLEKIIVDLNYFSENGVWELVFIEIRIEIFLIFFVVVFSLKLKRWVMFFVINFLIFVFMILMLNILVFILLLDSGECVGYFIMCFLVLVVFFIFVLEGFL